MSDGGSSHPALVLYSTPTTWRSLGAKLTWVLHRDGLSNPLPAHHSALAWDWVQPILWVNLIAQVTHLTLKEGRQRQDQFFSPGSTPIPACLVPGIGPRYCLMQSPLYRCGK